MAYIYKITNIVNDKLYIGYTKNSIEERLRQHIIQSTYKTKHGKRKTKLENAISKYGKDNFKTEIVQEVSECDWGHWEKYYIELYNSTDIKFGYNMVEGGEYPPTIYGEENVRASLSDSDYNAIINMLRDYTEDMSEIARIFKVHKSTIERINKGDIRHNKSIQYPIREYDCKQKKAMVIISLLVHTNLNYKEIATLTNCVKTTPMEINSGHSNINLITDLRYPLRDDSNIEHNRSRCYKANISNDECTKIKYDTFVQNQDKRIKLNILNMLLFTNLKIGEIAKELNCRYEKVSLMNSGKYDMRELEFLKFPIKDNRDENIKTINRIKAVETIPLIGE